jgi:hypothetical protein
MNSIQEIGHNIRTQDNAITALPIFCVQQRERIWGVDSDYASGVAWVDPDSDYREADTALAFHLERRWLAGGQTKNWRRIGYIDRWAFVTACFTRAGCEAYLEVNGHNLKHPRIYVETGFRNKEWETVRNLLIFLSSVATPAAGIYRCNDEAARVLGLNPVPVTWPDFPSGDKSEQG